MKVAFICPFNLEKVTGTPFRAKTTIFAASSFSSVFVITTEWLYPNTNVSHYLTGPSGFYNFTRKAIWQLRKIRPDVIHCFTTVSVVSAIFYKLFFNLKVKIVFEMHGFAWFEMKGIHSFIKRIAFLIIDILGFTFASHIILMSFTQKDFLTKKLYKKNNISVIWGPIDFNIKFVDIPLRSEVVFGYLGNSSFWQGISYIIKAATILEKKNPTIKFQIAGFDFSDSKKFPKLSNIMYGGIISGENVVKFIQNCDFVISSRVEDKVSDLQYPHKLSVYLSSGRGVLGTNVSDQSRIVDESRAGVIVDPISADLLANSIQRITSLPYEERNQFGKNAAEYAKQNFSLSVFILKLKDIYTNFFGQSI